MNRAMIVGCCGAGKSTFAKKLHQLTSLPLIHLDQHYWQQNWVEPDKETWNKKVSTLTNRDQWIMDGNYSGTMDIRLAKADTIFYLDYPTSVCLWRITKRIWKYHGRTRSDMTNGCHERFDLNFYHYVATFNIRKRKWIYQKLNKLAAHKKVHVFRNDFDTKEYLNMLR